MCCSSSKADTDVLSNYRRTERFAPSGAERHQAKNYYCFYLFIYFICLF